MDPPSRSGSQSPSRTSSPPPSGQPSASNPNHPRDDTPENPQVSETVRSPSDVAYGTINTPPPSTRPSASERGSLPPDRPRSTTAGQTPTRSPLSQAPADRGRPRGRKPGLPRRPSATVQALQRGGVFSVDDDILEVEADAAERASTIRRRSHVTTPVMHPRRADNEGGYASGDEGHDPVHGKLPEEAALPEPMQDDGDDPTPESRDSGETGVGNDEEEEDDDLSDAESFTLKDRQQAINQTHPFGIRIWKPALYKKHRSVQQNAEGDIHSSPGGHVSRWLLFFNAIWTLAFGWWMALIALIGALICFVFAASPGGRDYGRVLLGLSSYLFYPFGKFVRLKQQEPYLDEDLGEGRSISEYEQWQSGDLEYGRLFFASERNRSIIGRSRRSLDSEADDDETQSLLGGRPGRRELSHADHLPKLKRRLFGRGQWNLGRVIFFLFFYLLIAPSLFVVSAICWFLVFWIPMGRVTMLLFDHLRRHPLALTFEFHGSAPASRSHSSILLCTYRAAGLKYWKYTVDGTNIFLINLMAVVIFVIFDWLVLDSLLHIDSFFTSPAFLFVAGLLSIIPLAYFIGQAVASISAQSSMGLGAAINAFFSTVVEVFLYCVALQQGKGRLVEGSIIGSIFTGVLFLPGLSMCFGAIKRKTQRFNSKSAVVTSTMLLFAVIGAFGPTLFYQIYGTHQLNCLDCLSSADPVLGPVRDCRRCYFSQSPSLNDRFYIETVRPYCYLAASLLFLSYVIGLWFTLRTHAAVIWNADGDEKRQEEQQSASAQQQQQAAGPRAGSQQVSDATAAAAGADIRDSHLYKRILGHSLRHAGLQALPEENSTHHGGGGEGSLASSKGPPPTTPHVVPPKSSHSSAVHIPGFSEAENNNLVHQVAEIAATAAAMAARDMRTPRKGAAAASTAQGQAAAPGSAAAATSVQGGRPPLPSRTATFTHPDEFGSGGGGGGGGGHGGHDAPNWSRLKSSVILLGATLLYAIVAELLVDTVDVVLERFAIDEKFLGITLFALVPNTTEFLNAISFAMNGNIALSMEIGSAYALQVCLLQIPALVLFSALDSSQPRTPSGDLTSYWFTLLFPQWDMVTVILCVFLLSHMYGEGKSNYFKGSILLLSYLVVVVGYYLSGFAASMDNPGSSVSRFDTLGQDGQWMSYPFKTVGRGRSGAAFSG